MKTGIFYFIKQNDECIRQLKLSLYFLFKNFNAKFKHNVILFHTDEITSKNEIMMGIRNEVKHLITFQKLDPNIFDISKDSKDKMNFCFDINPKIDWGTIQERLLNRFWAITFWDLVKDYDYVMKLDCDLIIEEPLRECLFEIIKSKDLVYIGNMLMIDCPLGSYGMHDYFKLKFKDKMNDSSSMFVNTKIADQDTINKFKIIYNKVTGNIFDKSEIDCNQPISYTDSLYVTKPSYWNSTEIKSILSEIDNIGYILYYKWSSASIRSMIAMILNREKISRCIFRISKSIHRESFINSDGKTEAFIPDRYELSGCVTSK
jgi:hypothetical protein